MKNNDYIPGKCNINSYEVELRFRMAVLSLVISIILLIILLIFFSNHYIRLILTVPIFLMILNLFQTQQKFCVFYGLKGEENSKQDSKKSSIIKSLISRYKDRKKSIKMIILSILITLVINIPLVFLPNIN